MQAMSSSTRSNFYMWILLAAILAIAGTLAAPMAQASGVATTKTLGLSPASPVTAGGQWSHLRLQCLTARRHLPA